MSHGNSENTTKYTKLYTSSRAKTNILHSSYQGNQKSDSICISDYLLPVSCIALQRCVAYTLQVLF